MKQLFILLFILLSPFGNIQAENQIKQDISVKSVYDGDSIRYYLNNKEYKARLSGIDAPELDQPYGIESRDYLKVLLSTNDIKIKNLGKDIYNRELIVLYNGLDIDLNKLMVLNGSAWSWETNGGYYFQQEIAKKNNKGLWDSSKYENPINPKTWRRMNKSEKYFNLIVNPVKESCKIKEFKTCSMFETCEEAMFWFKDCKHTYLDGNNNDIPCETICKK